MKSNRKFVLFLRILFATLIIFCVPFVRSYLFPNKMTHVIKLLKETNFTGYSLIVVRITEGFYKLSITKGSRNTPIITTEIFIEDFHEKEMSTGNLVFFSHSINKGIDSTYYLTRTVIETDADIEHIQGIEASVCDRLQDQTGNVDYIGYEPIIKCADLVKTVVCAAYK